MGMWCFVFHYDDPLMKPIVDFNAGSLPQQPLRARGSSWRRLGRRSDRHRAVSSMSTPHHIDYTGIPGIRMLGLDGFDRAHEEN